MVSRSSSVNWNCHAAWINRDDFSLLLTMFAFVHRKDSFCRQDGFCRQDSFCAGKIFVFFLRGVCQGPGRGRRLSLTHVGLVAVRSEACHQEHPVLPRHRLVRHFQHHVRAGEGKLALLSHPVPAVSKSFVVEGGGGGGFRGKEGGRSDDKRDGERGRERSGGGCGWRFSGGMG